MLPTNFQIFKNKFKKEGSTQPDFKISAKDENGKFQEIGAGWTKEMTNGDKYISCKLNINPAPVGLTDIEKENIKIAREREIKGKDTFDI